MKINTLLILLFILAASCTTSKQVSKKQEKDRVESLEHKNFAGERVEDNSGIAVTQSYYKDNKLVNVKYYGINDELLKGKSAWDKQAAEWRFSYDENGNFIKQTAHNAMGELMDTEHWSNSAVESLEYNRKNQLIKRSNYNREMKLVGLGEMRVAQTKYGYNELGQLSWKKSYNAKGNFIQNGFCYSKFEYHEDGSLKKHSYLYDENKLNMVFNYTYKDGRLMREESLDEKGKKTTHKVFKYNKKGRIIEIEEWYFRWEKPKFRKEEISLELSGWAIKESDLAAMNFKEAGQGEYEIKLDEQGNILSLLPTKYSRARSSFNYEVFENFRGINLKKEPGENQLTGVLRISRLNQELGIIREINQILQPIPHY